MGAWGLSDLISQVGETLMNDPQTRYVYIYTSRVHERLYLRGRPYIKRVEKINDRDVLLRFSTDDLRNFYRQEMHN